MAAGLRTGPYRVVEGPLGPVPWYMVPFDKAGRATGPLTARELVDRAAGGDFSDLVLFSHGWNNDWVQATARYQSFVDGYLDLLGERPPPGGARRALLAGVFWPSKLLVAEDREMLEIAGDGADAAVADERDDVAELAERLPAGDAGRFYALAQRDVLDGEAARELARVLAPLLATDDLETAEPEPPSVEEMLAAWSATGPTRAAPVADLDDLGFRPAAPVAAPEVAGDLAFLDPREVVRSMSVWLMKDRAGVVGGNGVAPLLADLLRTDVRVHCVGHSYGAKVLLSAICSGRALPRPVRSLLLLQPAVSHLCFAASVPGSGKPGGYRGALERVELPIVTTFSAHDQPLTRFFHLALRRGRDLGEPEVAAAGEPPNRYAALGGFGPRGADADTVVVPAADPGEPYDLGPPGPEVLAVDATRTISGHGDVSNRSTWWMLSQLLHAPG
jgi:hypothetical protein